jgi:hypothetical protein
MTELALLMNFKVILLKDCSGGISIEGFCNRRRKFMNNAG